jgi:hypothetical protein
VGGGGARESWGNARISGTIFYGFVSGLKQNKSSKHTLTTAIGFARPTRRRWGRRWVNLLSYRMATRVVALHGIVVGFTTAGTDRLYTCAHVKENSEDVKN